MGVPCATGPICSADGEGGGEGGKLAESSTAKGEKEREREGQRDRHRERQRRGWDGRTQMVVGFKSHAPLGFDRLLFWGFCRKWMHTDRQTPEMVEHVTNYVPATGKRTADVVAKTRIFSSAETRTHGEEACSDI